LINRGVVVKGRKGAIWTRNARATLVVVSTHQSTERFSYRGGGGGVRCDVTDDGIGNRATIASTSGRKEREKNARNDAGRETIADWQQIL